MATEKIDVSVPIKRALEQIKEKEGHLNMDSVIRSRMMGNDLNAAGIFSVYIHCDDTYVRDRLMHHHGLTTEQIDAVPAHELRDELMHRDGVYIDKPWSDIKQRSDMVLEIVRAQEGR